MKVVVNCFQFSKLLESSQSELQRLRYDQNSEEWSVFPVTFSFINLTIHLLVCQPPFCTFCCRYHPLLVIQNYLHIMFKISSKQCHSWEKKSTKSNQTRNSNVFLLVYQNRHFILPTYIFLFSVLFTNYAICYPYTNSKKIRKVRIKKIPNQIMQ